MRRSLLLPLLLVLTGTPEASAQESPAPPAASTGTVPAPAPEPAALPGMEARTDEPPRGPWWVSGVAVEGERHVKEKVIRAQIRARVGDLYTQSDVGRDIQKVMDLGNFDKADAEVTVDTTTTVPHEFLSAVGSSVPVRLVYRVQEKPLVNKVRIKGQKGVGKGAISDELAIASKDPFDSFKLREGEAKIVAMYREKGYSEASVETAVSTSPKKAGYVDIEVKVSEGPRAKVSRVLMDGVTAFKVKKLVKKMKLRPKKVFDPKKLEEDLQEVSRHYKTRGYPDFEILTSTYVYDEKKTGVTIGIHLKEGLQRKFGRAVFAGNTVYPDRELKKLVTFKKGKLFDTEKLDETVALLQDKYAEVGRLRTRVEPVKELDEATGLTDVRFDVTEGSVMTVDHIDIEGNTATKTHVLRRELAIKEGQVVSSVKIRKSREKLFNLGYMEDVQVDFQPSATDPDKLDLVFSVTEGKPGMLTAGAGYSSIGGLVGTLSVSHMNLFSRAQRLSVVWQFGKRVQDYHVNWSTRWLGDSPTSLAISVFDTRRLKPFSTTFSAFTDRRTGGNVTVGPRFQDDKYKLSLGYGYQKIRVSDVSTNLTGQLQTGTSVLSTISAEFARDTRDNIFFPESGNLNSASVEVAGIGGDVHYYKPGVQSNWFVPTFSIGDHTWVVAFLNRAGYIRPWDKDRDTPVFDRFFLGGPDTVRGYNVTGQIGPLSGGNVYYVGNLEYQFPLVRERRRTMIQGAFFTDVGGAWEAAKDVSLAIGSEPNQMKSSVGFGIRFTTPVFPIRLDYGYGLNHRPGNTRWQIHFAIGGIAF